MVDKSNEQSRRAAQRHFVDGVFQETVERFANVNPVSGDLIDQVCEADRRTVDMAVAAARKTLTGAWGNAPPSRRVAILRDIADRIEARFDDFAHAEITDTGKPLQLARRIDIPRGAANFRMFADLAGSQAGQCFDSETPDDRGALNYTINKPLGVVAVISPWNLPLLLLTWKVAPALAAGNAVVAKPSEETPSTATLLAEVISQSDLPPGAFNLLHGHGPGAAGEFLASHPGIDAITFTGESATGSAIMRAAAPGTKPVSFELGGKNAAVVFADAEFERAVTGVARSTFLNSGQVCLCSERIYVERSIFHKFVDALKRLAEGIEIGRPADGAEMGPLISHAHREKVLAYYCLARREGAQVICGGGIPRFDDDRDAGAFIEPTLWTGLADDARSATEEIFGPCAHIRPFDRESEVVALVNDSTYGLAATLWTTNLQRAHRIASRFDVGMLWINDWFLRDLRTPFGGVKSSGVGREGGAHSFAFYSQPMTVCVKL